MRTERIKDHSSGCCLDTDESGLQRDIHFDGIVTTHVLTEQIPATLHCQDSSLVPPPPASQWQSWTASAPAAVWNKGQLPWFSIVISTACQSNLCRFYWVTNQVWRINSQMLPQWLDLAGGPSQFVTLVALPFWAGNRKINLWNKNRQLPDNQLRILTY